MPKQEFLCRYCGRRVFAARGVLTAVQLCRSCFEKARSEQRSTPPTDTKDQPKR